MIEPRTVDRPAPAPRKRKEREDDEILIDNAIDAFGLDDDDAEPEERRRDPLRRR